MRQLAVKKAPNPNFQLGRVDDFYLNSLLMGTFGKGFYGSAIEDSLRKKERRSAGTVAGAVERFCSVGGVGAFREVFTNKEWYHTNPNYLEVKFGTKSWQVFNHLVTHHFRRDTVDCSILKLPKDSNQLEELYEPQAQPGSSPGPVHRAMGSDTNRAAVTHAKFPDSVDKLCSLIHSAEAATSLEEAQFGGTSYFVAYCKRKYDAYSQAKR